MHCFSVGVEIKGKEREVCTVVPGNDKLKRDLDEADRTGKKMRNPTEEEIDRAVDFHLKHTHEDKDERDEKKPAASLLSEENY